jgi:hypothetical protein
MKKESSASNDEETSFARGDGIRYGGRTFSGLANAALLPGLFCLRFPIVFPVKQFGLGEPDAKLAIKSCSGSPWNSRFCYSSRRQA